MQQPPTNCKEISEEVISKLIQLMNIFKNYFQKYSFDKFVENKGESKQQTYERVKLLTQKALEASDEFYYLFTSSAFCKFRTLYKDEMNEIQNNNKRFMMIV